MSILTECKYKWWHTLPDGKEVLLNCGHCVNCTIKKKNDWSFRTEIEHKKAKSACFRTLTYSDETIPVKELINKDTGEIKKLPVLNKEHVGTYIRSIRRKHSRALKKRPLKNWPKLKYIKFGEYGSQTNRPHYHVLYFNLHPDILKDFDACWAHGIVHTRDVDEKACDYGMKDMFKSFKDLQKYEGFQEPFMHASNGYGEQYVNENKNYHREKEVMFAKGKGYKRRLPRYYKDKIWAPDEKPDTVLDKTVKEILDQREKEKQILYKNGYKSEIEAIEARERRKERFKKLIGNKTI